MSTNDQGTTDESDFADMEIKLVYRDREVPALLTRDFLESSVEYVKQQIIQLRQLAPITESVDQLALYVKLPVKQEDILEELTDGHLMLHYIEKLSSCLELILKKREV